MLVFSQLQTAVETPQPTDLEFELAVRQADFLNKPRFPNFENGGERRTTLLLFCLQRPHELVRESLSRQPAQLLLNFWVGSIRHTTASYGPGVTVVLLIRIFLV